MGAERLVLMLETLAKEPAAPAPSAYVIVPAGLARHALLLAAQLRKELEGHIILCHCGGGKPPSQLKRAFALGAQFAVVLDERSLEEGQVKLRQLDDSGQELRVAKGALAQQLKTLLAAG